MKKVYIYMILFVCGLVMSIGYFIIIINLSKNIVDTIEYANIIDIIIILIYLFIYLPIVLVILKNIKKQLEK